MTRFYKKPLIVSTFLRIEIVEMLLKSTGGGDRTFEALRLVSSPPHSVPVKMLSVCPLQNLGAHGRIVYRVTFMVLLPIESHPKKKLINQSATP